MPPARCTSSMWKSGWFGATLLRQGTRRDSPSMSASVKSTPASCAAARMCSTVLVEPPMATSRVIALANAALVAMPRGVTVSSSSS